jgi:lysophospholipase L1-like esterase
VLPALAATLVAAITAAGCTSGDAPQRTSPDVSARPRTMAALGDSITRGYAACGRGGDCVDASWATGTVEDVASHRQRLGADRTGEDNLAVSGARVGGLATQARAAVRARPDYVTVLIGANDACASDEAAMTSVEEFTDAFDEAVDVLLRGLPDARVLVVSVPDLLRLWQVGKDRPDVVQVWQSTGVCRSMLADPTDTSAEAQARRDRVRGRVQAYNAVMATACARYAPRCRHDGNAVFDYRFHLDDVSTVDYWHPSERGQATLAKIAWEAGFWP